MSFRKSQNETDRWETFLAPLSPSIQSLPALQGLFVSPSALENLFQNGDEILTTLDEVEWMHLNMVVNRFADQWQSWFTPEMYPAIQRQRERRPWTPAETPVSSTDFSGGALLVHLWAPWNGYSRLFHETFSIVAKRFAIRMTFRSFNVDWQCMHDYFSETDRLQGPNHLYYNAGTRLYAGFGLPSVNELSSKIEQWLDNQKSR